MKRWSVPVDDSKVKLGDIWATHLRMRWRLVNPPDRWVQASGRHVGSGHLARLLGRDLLFTDVINLSYNHMGAYHAMLYTIRHLSQRLP